MATVMEQTLVAIGASTGGTDALRNVLQELPSQLSKAAIKSYPAVLVTQHIAPQFAQALADSLNKSAALPVALVQDGERIEQGRVYLAPGDRHLVVKRNIDGLHCYLQDSPARDKCKPSVDVMFESLAEQNGINIVAVLLTGMGKDGAKGLLKLKQQGAYTIAQDEASSVVWGMPGEAVKIAAVHAVVSLEQMAKQITARLVARPY